MKSSWTLSRAGPHPPPLQVRAGRGMAKSWLLQAILSMAEWQDMQRMGDLGTALVLNVPGVILSPHQASAFSARKWDCLARLGRRTKTLDVSAPHKLALLEHGRKDGGLPQ